MLRVDEGDIAVTDNKAAADGDEFQDAPSGSAALAERSEADPWVARASGPWNPPDTTSPNQSTHSGSTSPTHVRNSISTTTPQLSEIQNLYPLSRPTIGQGGNYTRSQPKGLDPSSGPFKYVQKPSTGFNDDKENSGQYSADYSIDISSRSLRGDRIGSQNSVFLGIGNSASRDGSVPPSRASDSGLNSGGLPYGNGNLSFGSIGHTPTSSIHSNRPSFSGLSGSYQQQPNGSRYTEQSEVELRENFKEFNFGDVDSTSASQINNGGTSYSPGNPNYAPGYQFNGGSTMWNENSNNSKGSNNYEAFSNQPFPEQSYFNKPRFDRGSVSPAGSDYRRGINSPKYYSSAGTPPAEQIYRPGSRGPRIPQGPSELDRRLQNIHYAQQQNYYNHFQGQYPPLNYDFPPQNFRQSNAGYGYMPAPSYSSTQVVPTRPAKDQDVGVGVRSVLLEEFRSNSKSVKRYELKVCVNGGSKAQHKLTFK